MALWGEFLLHKVSFRVPFRCTGPSEDSLPLQTDEQYWESGHQKHSNGWMSLFRNLWGEWIPLIKGLAHKTRWSMKRLHFHVKMWGLGRMWSLNNDKHTSVFEMLPGGRVGEPLIWRIRTITWLFGKDGRWRRRSLFCYCHQPLDGGEDALASPLECAHSVHFQQSVVRSRFRFRPDKTLSQKHVHALLYTCRLSYFYTCFLCFLCRIFFYKQKQTMQTDDKRFCQDTGGYEQSFYNPSPRHFLFCNKLLPQS